MRTSAAKAEVFDAYGDGPDALEAFANLHHQEWSEFVDSAALKQWKAEYATWRRGQVRSVERDLIAADRGSARLFDLPEGATRIDIRSRLIFAGIEHDTFDLAGRDGAAVLRLVAERDGAPARTVLVRSNLYVKLADHIESESKRLGRDVSVAEVLELGAAA